ncbi:MAG: hypothetical protein JGK37_08245 [Microcoleus sp. PH2017_06_SFM_O_A]|nr:hypothetical protein [Microcoleus sp. PH2017_06_SFM_O_A]
MIGYVTIGTNNLERAANFYDTLLAEIGAQRFMEFDQFIAWSVSPEMPGLAITKPFDGNRATVGAGYFRDLDGNKLNVFCMIEPNS